MFAASTVLATTQAYAQQNNNPDEPSKTAPVLIEGNANTNEPAKPELGALLRYSFEEAGISTQNLFKLKWGDLAIKGMISTAPDDIYNTGLDVKTKKWRLNFGAQEIPDGTQGHALGTLYFDKAFAGGAVQLRSKDNPVGIAFGGYEFSPNFSTEATADTEGNIRAVGFTPVGEGLFGAHVALNKDREPEAGFSYNTDKLWANVRFGESRKLDARLVIGDVNPRHTQYWQSVTGSGVNDLSDLFYDTDHTFKFGIGKDINFDFFGPENKFLGEESKSTALELRLRENNKLTAKLAHRIGSIGPFDRLYVMGGVEIGLQDLGFQDKYTGILETGFTIKDLENASFKVQGRLDNDGEARIGAFLEIAF